MTEADIMHENGRFWVLRERGAFTVCRCELTHSVTIQSFARDADGLSLARVYCDYLASVARQPKTMTVVPTMRAA